MGSAAAKRARKASGVKFVHPTKVGTPFQERHTEADQYWLQWHPRQKNQQYGVSRRAQKKFSDQAEFLASFASAPEPKHRKK